NMDIDHVAFAGTSKFDGHRIRRLAPNELAQIAGRAGRYRQNGSFGVTGEAQPFESEVVEAIENHRFRPVPRLYWRNGDLRFGSVPQLVAGLEAAPDDRNLMRGRDADDLAALRMLWNDPEIAVLAEGGTRVRLLWDVCQIPDFRNTVDADHVALLGRIYRFLLEPAGVIPSDWLAGQVRRLDRVDGDIDTLSKRLSYIRTWTYVANRGTWVGDPAHWRGTTREVEDRLSDALHQRLTQRFVDRRTSVLMRRLKQKERLVAEVNDKGEVAVEGEYVGRLDGFRFTVDETAAGEEVRTLRTASLEGLRAELARRADKLYLSPDGEIELTEQGGLMWGTDAIGRLEKGDGPLAPKVRVFVDDMAEAAVTEKVERRLGHWVQRRIAALFEPMLKMRDDEAVTGLARGVAFQLAEAMGILPRRQIADDVKQLGQEERALLRKHGVRFGQYSVFMPALLKPAPTRMRLILWALWQGLDEFPEAPPAGHVTVPADRGAPQGYYEKAGYRLCGSRAVRIDMLERLADMIRPMDSRAGFEATPDMLSITGATLEQFAEIMKGLGYDAARGERPKPLREKPAEATGAETPPADGEAPAEDAPAAEASAEVPTEGAADAPEGAPATAAAEPAADEAADGATGEAPAEAASPGGAAAGSDTASAAPAPDVEAGEPDRTEATRPAGEPETEVFYTFTYTPRRHQQGRRRAGEGPERGRGPGAERRARGGADKGPKSRRGPKRGDKADQKSDQKPDQKPQHAPKPRREDRPVDPDSPFAVLQKLKER
ncbi:MAG TPA: disulfide oxidoreductase, partial [Thermohalobaculum sp.]|nr:disulfide oxidoreductase [Thermohalobaculum sp.]